jgi:hypothetical protein
MNTTNLIALKYVWLVGFNLVTMNPSGNSVPRQSLVTLENLPERKLGVQELN